MFMENVAYKVAEFLELPEEEKRKNYQCMQFGRTLENHELTGRKRVSFGTYSMNLRYGSDGVYSYGARVIEANWRRRTLMRLGRWSRTTSKHQNYAITELMESWVFTDIQLIRKSKTLTDNVAHNIIVNGKYYNWKTNWS